MGLENDAIRVVPWIEEGLRLGSGVASRSAKVLFRQGFGHLRRTYIRISEKSIWTRQPDRSDDAAHQGGHEK